MTRAKWKGPHIQWHTLSKKRINPRIWSRSSVIPSLLINKIVSVYNGREFIRVVVNKKKVGFKFGEFSYTRKFALKKINKNIKIKKNLSKKK